MNRKYIFIVYEHYPYSEFVNILIALSSKKKAENFINGLANKNSQYFYIEKVEYK